MLMNFFFFNQFERTNLYAFVRQLAFYGYYFVFVVMGAKCPLIHASDRPLL